MSGPLPGKGVAPGKTLNQQAAGHSGGAPWRAAAALLLLILLQVSGPAGAQDPAAPPAETKVYIVQLREPATIEAVPGHARTGENGRFDSRSAAVRRHSALLEESHDQLLADIGAVDAKLYSYRLSFNGFAAKLTPEQVAQLRVHPQVLRVWADRVKSLRTNASPAALGLLDAGTGLRQGLKLTGENVIIGIIDSGITPEHPSFADRTEKEKPRLCRSEWAENSLLGLWLCRRFDKPRYTSAYAPPRDWYGRCQTGEEFRASDCNNKIIGARYYVEGFGFEYGSMDPQEFISPRDVDGHGTHIASVAAGARVKASIGGKELATISGMAPRARIAVYKACWLRGDDPTTPDIERAERASCAMSDLQRAIEDAVADGVDIINYSIGTATGGPADPDALALLAAADAGVFAVVAAGNNGPGEDTVESPGTSPWVTTVGSSSRAGQRFDEVVRINSPSTAAGDFKFREAGFTPTLRSTGSITAKLVLANDGVPAVADEEGSPSDACEPLLNPTALAGNIALMQRGGVCNFQEKISSAEAAGAVAVIVYGNARDAGAAITMTGERGSVDVPAVMINRTHGQFLAGRLAAGDAVEARLEKGLLVSRTAVGSIMQAQSARGLNANLDSILKPDLTAPGVDIMGAQTPDVANGPRGETFQYLTGTSMAVPHVAGVAALLRQAHPEWSPAVIRSALMTTARQDLVLEDTVTPAGPLDFGAGHIVPNRAIAPGLVYEADRDDYDAFACGAGFTHLGEERCQQLEADGYSMDPDNLNLPSIATSALVTRRSVTRRVTNVGPPARYDAVIQAPPGVSATVSPPSLTLDTGQSEDYTITFTNLGLEENLDQWNTGWLTWTSGDTTVSSPLVVGPGRLGMPALATGSGASGSTSFNVEFGYTGIYNASVTGLVPPVTSNGYVIDDPLNEYVWYPDDASLPDFIQRFRITVAPGVRYLRVALGPTDEGSYDDIDLWLRCPGGECADGGAFLYSATESDYEYIDILAPEPGEYIIDVHGYETDETVAGPGANFEVGYWAIPESGGVGNLSVIAMPAGATLGDSGQVSLGWDGLDPGQLYLGLVSHDDGVEELGLTLVEVTTPQP